MDENRQYLTVKQFAKAAGVSDKAIYKQLSTRLKKYTTTVDGKKLLDISALSEVYGKDGLKPDIQPSREEFNHFNQDSTQDFNHLLAEKQARIDELQVLINELRVSLDRERKHADRYIAEVSNWQNLYWEAHSKLIALEDKQRQAEEDSTSNVPTETENIPDQTPQNQEVSQEPTTPESQTDTVETPSSVPPKKKWWQRFLGL